MNNTPLGFDEFLETPTVLKGSVSASSSGDYVVSSSPGKGTFLGHKVPGGGDEVKISSAAADSTGFYGRNVDLVAIATGDKLRILHLHKMKVIGTIDIRPGSLFVPKTGNSERIGIVSPKGHVYVIDDKGQAERTPLSVTEEYSVLWSSSAFPVGYTWSDESAVYMYIRSRSKDKGATLSSTHGVTVFTAWYNPAYRNTEAYLVTHDEPHVLKRVWSDNGKAHVEKVLSLPQGAQLDNVVLLSNGRPSVASGFHNGVNVASPIPPTSRLSDIIVEMTTDQQRNVSGTCMGLSSLISWTQTPITPPVPAIVNYGMQGRPRSEIHGGRPRYTTLRSGDVVDFVVPTTNEVRTVKTKDGQKITYRYVSPLITEGHTSDTALVIVDPGGLVAAGTYSPMVKMCYDMGIPVAIVPVINSDGDIDDVIDDTVLDIIDVSRHVISSKLAKTVTVFASGVYSESAVRALNSKKSPVSNAIVYHCPDDVITRKTKKAHHITVVMDHDEDVPTDNKSVSTFTFSDDYAEKQIQAIDVLSVHV